MAHPPEPRRRLSLLLVALATTTGCASSGAPPAQVPASPPLATAGPSPSAAADPRAEAYLREVPPERQDLEVDDLGYDPRDALTGGDPVVQLVPAGSPPDPCDPFGTSPLPATAAPVASRSGTVRVTAAAWTQSFRTAAWVYDTAAQASAVVAAARARVPRCAAELAADRDSDRGFVRAAFRDEGDYTAFGVRWAWAYDSEGGRLAQDRLLMADGRVVLLGVVTSTGVHAPAHPAYRLVNAVRGRTGPERRALLSPTPTLSGVPA